MPLRQTDRAIAREISYAHSARTKSGRALIRGVENATGRLRLIRRAAGYEVDVAEGRDFWDVMVERYGLSLDLRGGSLDNLPKTGPLVVIANHPFGILDGLVMGYILRQARGDFRILANQVFRKARELDEVVLPVSFDETREGMQQNLATRKTALEYLAQGGCMGVFPGGTVSTAARPMGRALDPGWRNFTAKMISKSGATVVPIYFEGANSRLFQLASHVHPTLRLALLIKEFKSRVDRPVRLIVGQPIARADLAAHSDTASGMMDFLRAQTYALAPDGIDATQHGFEFEERRKRG